MGWVDRKAASLNVNLIATSSDDKRVGGDDMNQKENSLGRSVREFAARDKIDADVSGIC